MSILCCLFLCVISAVQIRFSNGPHPYEQLVDGIQLPLSKEDRWLSTQENKDHKETDEIRWLRNFNIYPKKNSSAHLHLLCC